MTWVKTDDLDALIAYLTQAAGRMEPRRNAATGELIEDAPALVWDTPQQYEGGWVARAHPEVAHSFAVIDPPNL